VDLQAVKTSINTQTGSLKVDIKVTKKDSQETIANMRNDTQTTRAEIRTNEERMEA
jgi:hypothetical protein